jgi:hypothetical protein
LPREGFQSGPQCRRFEFGLFPRGLERHTKLPTRDLFFEGLDIGLLFEQEIRNTGDNPGLVAPDNGNGGKLLHGYHE